LNRAVIYCRVSTKEQTHNLSLATQLRVCREYCQRQGMDIAQEFEDAGESAKTTDRPAFREMLAYCRAHKRRVQFVVVYNLTRFSRNTHDHSVVRALLLGLGVRLRSASEPISDDSVGRLTENMLAAIAQFDNDQKADRTKAGMQAALQRGQWAWRAPVGYINGDTRAGQPSLIPDRDRAPLVQRAFEMVGLRHQNPKAVLQAVTALGLTTRGGRPVTFQTFSSVLRNPLYAGLVRSHALGIDRVRGDFQALISEFLFDRTQAVLAGRHAALSHTLNHPDFPLRRFVICDACSTPLTGSAPRGRKKNYRYYHCRRCKGVSIRAEKLESQFVELLELLRPRAEFMGLFRAIVLDVWRARREDAGRIRRELESRLSGLQQRETVLDEAFLYERRIDSASYERQRDKVRENIALIRIELEEARIEEVDVEGILGYAEHVLNNGAQLWIDATPEQRQRLQLALFPQGLRFKDGTFGTAVTCLAFMPLAAESAPDLRLASPTGFEPVFWP
jgi:site-specific DNA recombinase